MKRMLFLQYLMLWAMIAYAQPPELAGRIGDSVPITYMAPSNSEIRLGINNELGEMVGQEIFAAYSVNGM